MLTYRHDKGGVNQYLSTVKVQDVLIFWGVQYIGAHNSGEASVLITFLPYLFVFLFLAINSLLLFHVGLYFLFIIEMSGNQYLFDRTRSGAQLGQIFEVF